MRSRRNPSGPYILTRKSVNKTARIIRDALGIDKSYEPRAYPPIIRWGNSDGQFNVDTTTNDPELIRTAANKLRLYNYLKGSGISVVEIKNGVPDKFPVLIRQTLTGSKGIGAVVCHNIQEFMSEYINDYWAPWYKFDYELGVHVLGGEIKKIFRKTWNGEGNEEEFPIKNADRGYHFSLVDMEAFFRGETYKKLVPFIKNLYEKFPLEMGRFDIGYINGTGYYLIEINSAPSLAENENTFEMYIEYIKKSLQES